MKDWTRQLFVNASTLLCLLERLCHTLNHTQEHKARQQSWAKNIFITSECWDEDVVELPGNVATELASNECPPWIDASFIINAEAPHSMNHIHKSHYMLKSHEMLHQLNSAHCLDSWWYLFYIINWKFQKHQVTSSSHRWLWNRIISTGLFQIQEKYLFENKVLKCMFTAYKHVVCTKIVSVAKH